MLILRFWQVLVNFHLFRLKGKWNCWLTWKWLKKKPGDFTYPRLFFPQAWCLFLIFWGRRKCFVRKLCCKGQHPPLMLSNSVWSLLLLSGPKNHNNLTFLWICYCLFAGQGLSSSEDNDIAQKQKPKENQKRKKKGKKNFDSGNVLGWTWTVPKGKDVETLQKLLYLCFCFNGFNVHVSEVVVLYSVLVNSECNLHYYKNMV